MALTPQFFRLNTVNAAFFPFERLKIHSFSGSTPLTPLFFQFNVVSAAIFPLNAVNAAIFPVQRR